MASDFVRKVKGIRNIDILSPNITTENDLISTIDGKVYVSTNKGYKHITGGEKGDKGDPFKFKDFTPEQLEEIKGDKGDPFKFKDFTPEQLEEIKGDKGDTTLASPKIYARDEYNKLETKDNNTLYFISEV